MPWSFVTHSNPISAAVTLDGMGILWSAVTHSNPISAAVSLDGMGILWFFVTHSNPISAAVCLNAMGWCEIRRNPIVVGLSFGMWLSHSIPIVDAMGNVWDSAKYVEIP